MQLEVHLRLCQRCLLYCKGGPRLFSLSTLNGSALNYYDLLGVKPDASLEEIKNAFFNKSKKLHPDSDPDDPSLHSQFVALNEAYRVLIREESRREYDLRIRYRYHGGEPFSPAYGYTSKPPSRSAQHAERMRYWEQFRYAPPQENTAEHRQRQKKQNMRLVGYCVLGMLASVCIHYFGFRKLEEMHNNFMDEKDRVITQIYNESKERARINGFQKQTEILRQKHAEFLEKYKWRRGGGNK
ncbi:dnaJ homolog subfamily C member 4 [Paramormyrops kingsleyae]|uniref:DnaJ (Hsp40) homolog, subfamily C, member 4 n=1 Tax=Paramormyrops kingsleyae TaxID=1676925 RepID=A0A3B3SWT6_9TELE|nr:dnaJ homolog subfamily C member 4 [Paramormyrops kingsleyae]XP_023667270.1 dnaJ homolog subfamily C member 4 [Paramormyrops kingsleyae]XP_023667271.1 dnaJ homolog subfamily C member 4 [Paramormyrops kingsleyae]